jgi:glycosyltransferase involved in cell wall biosynthesis
MKMAGAISVIVPCFNAREYVAEAFLSVQQQTYQNFEIVAVNDGSTDDTPRLLERHAQADSRIRVVSQVNRGLAAARNAGLREARGEFVCFLDADDVLLPDKFEKQVRYLGENSGVDLVYSDYFISNTELELTGLIATRIPKGDMRAAYVRKNWFACMTPLVRRSLIDKVGEFDETLRASEDWDYWIRCASAGVFGYLPGPVAIYRSHPAQMHTDGGRMFNAGKRVICKHFRSNPRQYTRAMAAFYELHAKYAWSNRKRLKAALYLVRSMYHDNMTRLYRAPSHDSKPPVGSPMKTA